MSSGLLKHGSAGKETLSGWITENAESVLKVETRTSGYFGQSGVDFDHFFNKNNSSLISLLAAFSATFAPTQTEVRGFLL